MPALTFSSTQKFSTPFGKREAEVVPSRDVLKFIMDQPETSPLRNFRPDRFTTGKFGRLIVANERDLNTAEVVSFLEELKKHYWVLMTHDMDAALGRRDSGEFKTKLSFMCANIDWDWITEQSHLAEVETEENARRTELIERAITDETSTLIAAARFNHWSYVLANNHEQVIYIDLDEENGDSNSYVICGVQPNDVDAKFKLDLLVASDNGVPTGEVITVDVNQMLHVVPSKLPYAMRYNLELRQIFWYSNDGSERFQRWAVEGNIELTLKLEGRSDTHISVAARHMYANNNGTMTFNVNWPALGSESPKNTKAFAQCLNYAATMARSWEEFDTEITD